MLPGGGQDILLEGLQVLPQGVDLVPHKQPQVQGHLIVAAPAGMQLPSHRSDPGGQSFFHEHVDVFIGQGEGQLSPGPLLQNLLKPLLDQSTVLVREDALPGQHFYVGQTAGNIVGQQANIIRNRGRKRLHQGIDGLGKPAGPKLFRAVFSASGFFSLAPTDQGLDSEPQAVQPDESLGVFLPVDLIGLEGGEILPVKGIVGFPSHHQGIALIELQPDQAGHPFLGFVDQALQAVPAPAKTSSRSKSFPSSGGSGNRAGA